MTDLERLQTLINEGQVLLARNEGVHKMHVCQCNLIAWRDNVEYGMPMHEKAWANAEETISTMRQYDKTKKWPK